MNNNEANLNPQVKEDLYKVEALREGESCYINWFQGGGCMVTLSEGKLSLQEVPAFGGDPGRPLYFLPEQALKLVERARSWC